MYHIIFIYSSTNGHLACFQILSIVNIIPMNIGVHIFFLMVVSGFLGYTPRSGIPGSNGTFVFSFLRKYHTLFHSDCASLHSHQQCTRFSFSPRSLQDLFVDLLLVAIPAGGSDTHCSFNLYLSDD